MDDKEILHGYLTARRDGLLRKLDGLSEYDARRPMTATGTNIAGLVKHVASVQLAYFGEVFGRPADRALPWEAPGSADDDDMWLQERDTVADIVEFHHYSAAHADETIRALDLHAPGEVPWWPEERRHVSLLTILTHVISETAQHCGHADILRESLDFDLGKGPGDPNIPERTADDWASYCAKIEAAAVSRR